MGDVTVYDEKLAANADFHVWNVAGSDESDALSVEEDLAFKRLRDGVAGEASRPALRGNVADCLVPEIVQHPERAAGLVRALEGSCCLRGGCRRRGSRGGRTSTRSSRTSGGSLRASATTRSGGNLSTASREATSTLKISFFGVFDIL